MATVPTGVAALHESSHEIGKGLSSSLWLNWRIPSTLADRTKSRPVLYNVWSVRRCKDTPEHRVVCNAHGYAIYDSALRQAPRSYVDGVWDVEGARKVWDTVGRDGLGWVEIQVEMVPHPLALWAQNS